MMSYGYVIILFWFDPNDNGDFLLIRVQISYEFSPKLYPIA